MCSVTVDRAGNVLSSTGKLTRPDGTALSLAQTNTYDAAGRVTQWSTHYGTRSAGAAVTYGKYGTVSKESYSNNVERTYSYDCHGWLTQVQTSMSPVGGIVRPILGGGAVASEFYAGVAETNEIIGVQPIDPGPIVPMTGKTYTESILYADGLHPRYDGTASAHVSTLGGRYDYAFDGHDRLTAADYTAGADAQSYEDFSTAYEYNDAGAPVTLWRKGVISMEEDFDGEPIETFGEMDYLDYAWNGAQLVYVDAQPLGWDFYGRTGFAGSASGDGADFAWDEAGQMTADSSRGITDIEYNWAGQPVRVVFNNKQEIQYGYTCDGVLQTQKIYMLLSGKPTSKPKSTRTYAGDFVFENDTLSMINFPGGYFDSKGRPCYRHTDWQGNVTMVTDASGHLVQHTGYYPYGEPWREPAGQPYLFAAKERLRDNGLNEYDFSARRYYSALGIWITPDPKAAEFAAINPYIYCADNPIRYIDPSGCDYWQLQEDGTFKLLLITKDVNDVIVGRDYETQIQVDKGFVDPIIEEPITSKNENSNGEIFTASIYATRTNGKAIFEFLAENSDVEWSNARTCDGINYIGTSHDVGTDGSIDLLRNRFPDKFSSIIRYDHSHTNEDYTPSQKDVDFTVYFKENKHIVNFYVYNRLRPKNKKYFFYNSTTETNIFDGFVYTKQVIPSPIIFDLR